MARNSQIKGRMTARRAEAKAKSAKAATKQKETMDMSKPAPTKAGFPGKGVIGQPPKGKMLDIAQYREQLCSVEYGAMFCEKKPGPELLASQPVKDYFTVQEHGGHVFLTTDAVMADAVKNGFVWRDLLKATTKRDRLFVVGLDDTEHEFVGVWRMKGEEAEVKVYRRDRNGVVRVDDISDRFRECGHSCFYEPKIDTYYDPRWMSLSGDDLETIRTAVADRGLFNRVLNDALNTA